MVNYKPKSDDMEMWLICTAIGRKNELINKMKKNEDGSYPVIFSVGGIELDFNRVAKRIDEEISRLVRNKAETLLDMKFENLIGEIIDIQERLEAQKESLFKYDWEEFRDETLKKESEEE